ncbi:nuclear speckle splicing regulatory protein 1 [Nasonia vitripennis]|uniref:Nuclear speckle splicing regulatory protein 1 N-terminal domain-containing protein n=1 Tax=Nasonia vitripennis TaxID=7425 RepID=A0A7M7IWH9_NASVI|nr:nuclear speckle splicing regulatory protein 1 [Nasonia vitripennis]
MAKQYGLVLPKKNLSAPKAGNVFGNDDDSEEEGGTDWVKKALKAENEKNKIKRQTQINMQKALKEDPSIFQYDEVYDEIERTKEEERSVKKVEKKAKYIDNLLKTAELRKKEQELRKDRIIQKEIEAEDAMFPDKERYVTSSYKAKLEEMKKFEAEQDNQDRLEAIGDVTKQKDMSGFYRHLYRQTVEKNDADLGIKPKISKESEKVEEKLELKDDIDKDDPIPSDSESDDDAKDIPKSSSVAKLKKKRQYRKRAQEASESESEPEPEKQREKEGEAETDKSEKTDSKHESESPSKKAKTSDEVEDEEEKSSIPSAEEVAKLLNKKYAEKTTEETPTPNGVKETVEEKPKVEEKVKINIWEKRTVGPIFEAALQRYLIRKQERLAGS